VLRQQRARARSVNPSLGVAAIEHLQLHHKPLQTEPHFILAIPVTYRRAHPLLRLIATSQQPPLSLIHAAAHIEAANAEPNPPDLDTPLNPPTATPSYNHLQHVPRRSPAAAGCAERLPQEPCRFRQHHHPNREEAPEARFPVQCYLRW